MRLSIYLLLPAVALVAQSSSNLDLAQRFNAELPAVNQLLKELKTPEALAKVQSLVPAERPPFNATSAQAIGQSLDNAQGLASLYRLWANVASESGLWEKALEIQEKRALEARGTLSDLEKAQAPIANQWKSVAQESGDYIAKSAPRQLELQASLKALQDEVAAVNAKQKKLDSKGVEELKARVARAPQDQQELDQILAALPVHKQNIINAPKVTKMLGDNRKEVEGMVKAAEEAISKAKEVLVGQNDEITKFNTDQVLKKVKIVGRKNWVDAVLRVPENITKLGNAQAQVAFLNRLLVLDPGNSGALKALENLRAGKEAFPKEAKPGKKSGAKKK